MVDRALEQPGDRGEVDMRMRANVHPAAQIELRGAELIDEDEGADHAARLGGQHTSDLELAEIVRGRGEDLIDLAHCRCPY